MLPLQSGNHMIQTAKSLHLSLLLFMLTVLSNIRAQEDVAFNPEIGNLFVKNYSRAFLNSTAGNWCLLQDRDGVIYIGNTADGVIIYDGQRLSRVLDEKGDPKIGLARDLVMDSKQTIYTSIGPLEFGYIEKNAQGESIYHPLSTLLDKKEEVTSVIWGIAMRHDTAFIQSERKVYLYRDKKLLRTYSFDNITHVINAPADGIYLRVWKEGLYKFSDGRFNLIQSSRKMFANNRIDAMFLLTSGEHLLISRNIGLWLLKKNGEIVKLNTPTLDRYAISWESYIGNQPLRSEVIPMTTSKAGMVFFDQNFKLLSILDESNGLLEPYVSNYLQDRSGDIWGTSSGNVFKASFDTSLTYFSEINGLRGTVETVRRLNGRLYVRTNRDLYYLQPKDSIGGKAVFVPVGINELGISFTPFGDQIVTTNNYTIKVTRGRKTILLSNLYRSRVSRQSKLNPNLLFTTNTAYGLLVHEYRNGEWRKLEFPGQDMVVCISAEEIEPGKLALTSRDGLYIYEYDMSGRGIYTRLKRDSMKTQKDVFNIVRFEDKHVYAVDSLFNFYEIDLRNKSLRYTGHDLREVANRENFYYSYNPESGNGWVLANTGIFRMKYDPRKGFNLKKYPFYKVDLNELGRGIFSEGKGENEVLWIGSQDSRLYRYHPEIAIRESHTNHQALIRSVSSNGRKLALDLASIPYAQNNLSFEVAYPVFGNEEKTKFSYWLEGQDKGWNEYTSDSKKEYTNLKEGRYTLHVRAMDASGQLSGEAVHSFSIAPPWYRSLVAYAVYLLLLFLAFIQFGKIQARRSLKQAEDERKNAELAAAKDLQNRLLPKQLPALSGLDIAGYLRTSTEVGGDYYDFFPQPDGSLYMVCGDATGHGTPAGMLVSITKAGIIGLPQLPPGEMLHQLNRVVKKVDLGILRMSLNIAYLKGDSLTLSSAGMPPYFLYRGDSCATEEIMISGVPLGSFNNAEYDEVVTHFRTGDILVIISDGLPEAPNLSGQLFDYTRVEALITANATETAQSIIDILVREADQWLSGRHNPDDITIIVTKKA